MAVKSVLSSEPSSVRRLEEMKSVIYQKDLADKNPDKELYSVWREVDSWKDLRYDITLIKPGTIGDEFIRTKGNENNKNFPELYTVLEGEAIFLIQKQKINKIEMAEEIYFVKAKKGDWVNVPPNLAVIIINPSKNYLKTGNWVSKNNQNIYKKLEEMGGMCYFALKGEGKKIVWAKNKNYSQIPPLKELAPLSSRPEDLSYLL